MVRSPERQSFWITINVPASWRQPWREREREHRKKTSKKQERPRERKEKENPVAVSCFPWFLEFL